MIMALQFSYIHQSSCCTVYCLIILIQYVRNTTLLAVVKSEKPIYSVQYTISFPTVLSH